MVEKHKVELKKYPISYLIKKYLEEFVLDIGVTESLAQRYINHYSMTRSLIDVGKYLVTSGQVTLASLINDEKFTEKYKKLINVFFEKKVKLPDFIEVELVERSPYIVTFRTKVDFEKMLKSPPFPGGAYQLYRDFKQFLEDYSNIEFGSPAHGKLTLDHETPKMIGVDEWVKNTFEKKLKKKIRAIPGTKNVLTRMKLDIREQNLYAKLTCYFSSWNSSYKLLTEIEELLRSEGYNTNTLKVERG
jgi:hypothetical protein